MLGRRARQYGLENIKNITAITLGIKKVKEFFSFSRGGKYPGTDF
jgi:hypothetical protein